MAKLMQMVVDFNAYDQSNKLMGPTKVTLPSISWMVQSMTGAGVAGTVEAIAKGMLEAMTLSIDWRMCGAEAYKFMSPEVHMLTLRNAEQYEDPIAGQIREDGVKHVFSIMPKSMSPGGIAQASAHDGTAQYAVRSWKCFINGETVTDIDQLNGKCFMYGVDYRADINAVI